MNGGGTGELAHRMYADYGFDPDTTKRMHRPYVERFRGCRAVLDLGCGRGEFLELLGEAGVPARGVDLDTRQVEEDRARGLEVEHAEATAYLGEHPNSFDGIFAAHLVEHLAVEETRALLAAAQRALRPAGRLLLVVPNVASVGMHLDFYYRDFTHRGWTHPALLSFLCRDLGFGDVEAGENEAARYPYLGEAVQLYMTAEYELGEQLRVGVDRVAPELAERLRTIAESAHRLAKAGRSVVERLDRPFETWVLARRG